MSATQGPALTEDYLNANKGPRVLAIIITFPCLALLIVCLRLYTRFKIVNNPSYEDFSIILALVFCVATSICQGFQVYNGMGRHIQALTPEEGIGALKALFASIIMYNLGLTFTKLSIILQYLRITVDPIVRKGCWVLLWYVIANCFQTFITGIFSCYPVAKFWDDRIPGGCVSKSGLWYANAAINISQDIWLIVLPIFILRKLDLPRREKISLILILGLGGFASLASVLRLHSLYILSVSHDITWDNPGTATWSAMELSIGIICASLPTLRALLVKYFPRAFRNTLAYARNRRHTTTTNKSVPDELQPTEIIPPRVDSTELAPPPKVAQVLGVQSIPEDPEKGKGTFLASDSEQEAQHFEFVRP